MTNIASTDCVSSPFLNSIAGIHNTELISSPDPYSKLDSFDQKQELEKEFCRDFVCCGLNLGNLHQLLEHYEEYHMSHSSNSSSDDEETDPILQNGSLREGTTMLQQPMHLAQLAASYSSKEHLTKHDINILENARKYSSRKTVVTLDSIVDHLNTPSLSPTENIGYRGDNYFDEDVKHRPSSAVINSNNASCNSNEDQTDKPYRCHVADCDKAYKNANGLKYHRLHGHCPPGDGNDILDASKPYNCSLGNCRKRYKNLNGLKYHIEHTHMIKVHNLSSDMFINNTPSFDQQPAAKGLKRRYSSVSSSSSSVLSSETSPSSP